MYSEILFYLVFLCQIVLLSLYIPKRILVRIKYVMDHFPVSEYPKLYPRSVDYYHSRKRWFSMFNGINAVLGFVVMFLIYKWAKQTNGQINEMFGWAYFMLQLLPMILLEQSGFRQFRQMRAENVSSSRKAELRPRRLFDFVSPMLFWSTVMAYLVAAILILYIHDFGEKAYAMIAILLAGNLFFVGIVVWLMRGKKIDPYQDNKDRMRGIEYTIKPLLYVSVMMSVYAVVTSSVSRFELDFLEPVLMSVYCQVIAMFSFGAQLNNIRVEELNFDVYKKDVADS